MAEKYMETAKIIRQEEIAPHIFSMWLRAGEIARAAKPGQFIGIYGNDKSRLLPRPISICELDREGSMLRIVYRVAGAGTLEFSSMGSGAQLRIFGPLGNGFPMKGGDALLIGGGIGIPPLLELAKQLPGEVSILAGYRKELFLQEELAKAGTLHVATEDGSAGTRGTVMDILRERSFQPEAIYACGPLPMLRAVKAYGQEHQIETWVSMEEHMACGIGACLACVCKSGQRDSHTNVHNKRVCVEGPVFLAEEVTLE